MAQIEIRNIEARKGEELRIKLCYKWGYGGRNGERYYIPRAYIKICDSSGSTMRIWAKDVVELLAIKFNLVPGKEVNISKDYLVQWLKFTAEITTKKSLRKSLLRYIRRLEEF